MNDPNFSLEKIWRIVFAELIAGLAIYGATLCYFPVELSDDC